jgi:SAM-dependent methyltransferase
VTETIATAAEAGTLVRRLQEDVWLLAALAVALGDDPGRDPEQKRQAQQVLVELGLMSETSGGIRPAAGLAELMSGGSGDIPAVSAANLLQAAGMLSGATAWASQNDEALLAQGRGSAAAAAAFKMFGLPMLEGLGDLFNGDSPQMLDVGVGVGAMAVAYCRTFPGLRVVGLDVLPRALELARRQVGEAGLAERIELRQQDVASLEDDQAYALAWLPAPFVPRPALQAGLPRLARALVPGGWLMMAHGKLHDDPLKNALGRFQTTVYGGAALDDGEAQALLRGVGLEQVLTPPTPEGAPAITVGRRPGGPTGAGTA